jgi:hypothetical protein
MQPHARYAIGQPPDEAGGTVPQVSSMISLAEHPGPSKPAIR